MRPSKKLTPASDGNVLHTRLKTGVHAVKVTWQMWRRSSNWSRTLDSVRSKSRYRTYDLPRQIWQRSQLGRGKNTVFSAFAQEEVNKDKRGGLVSHIRRRVACCCFVISSYGKARFEVVPDGHVEVGWHLNFFEDKVIKIWREKTNKIQQLDVYY